MSYNLGRMCYSSMIQQNAKKYAEFFDVAISPFADSEEIQIRAFPHTEFPVIVELNHRRSIKWMNYSLVPPWSESRKPKFSTYNARIETLCEKPTWREPIKNKRCLVGITSFFESCYEGSHAGNIVQFKSPRSQIWAAAGIWSEWVDKNTGEIFDSFAIITTEPSEFIRGIGHDRSPVFLNAKDFDSWLSEETKPCGELKNFLLAHFHKLTQAEVVIERPLKPGWEKRV